MHLILSCTAKVCTVKSSLLVLLNELAAVKEMLQEMLKVLTPQKVSASLKDIQISKHTVLESNTTKSVLPRLYYLKYTAAGCTST